MALTDPPRAATLLAMAPAPPLPDLTAPLPAGQQVPRAATNVNDGLHTTQIVLSIAASAVALIGAIIALKR